MATQALEPRRRGGGVDVNRLASRFGILAFVLALGYLSVLPLIRLQIKTFADGAQPYRDAYTRDGAWKTVRYTIELGVGSLLIALVLGTFLAWAASVLPPRLRLLKILPIFPIILPAVSAIVGWVFLLSPVPGYANAALRHLPWWNDRLDGPFDIYTLPFIMIITGLSLASFVYLFVSSGFENITGELIEAAQVAGSSRAGVFFKVILPLLRPSLVYGGGVALLLGLGQFTAPLLLGRNQGVSVLTTDMYFATTNTPPDYALAAAIGSPLLVFGIIVLYVNRVLLGDTSRFVTHGGKGGFRQGTPGSKLAAVSIVLFGLISSILPMLALVAVSLTRFWTGTIDPSTWTLDAYRQLLDEPGITSAIWNSVVLSLAAVAIALPAGYIAASFLRRGREHRLIAPLLDFIIAMPLSIPAVIFGVGFLLVYTNEPLVLYGTKWVLVLVYVTLMIPFSTRMQLAGMAALGDAYNEASRVSGAGLIRTQLSIMVPLMRGTFGGAAALMFVLLTHEFAASLLVRGSQTQVMGTILYDYYENGTYPLVACISLVMILVTAAGVAVAVMLGGSEAFRRL
jgi:iron(III) transport system permease protein